MIEVVDCSDGQSGSWNEYLATSEASSFYHLFEWSAINRTCFGHRTYNLAALNGQHIRGVLPLVHVESRLFGSFLISMPFVNYGGICCEDESISKLLLDAAKDIANDVLVDYMEIRSLHKCDQSLETSTKKISMTIALQPDPESVWSQFKSAHRTSIRRAYKDGFEVVNGGQDLLDPFYKVLSESWKSLGTPIYKKNYFQELLWKFPEMTRIFVVYQNGVPVATAFNGYYRGTVEGMWAGTLPEMRRSNPNYVLYWEMIKHACENGYKTYHLGRSTAESNAETFKKKWNAISHQLYWQYYLVKQKQMPQLNVDNPKYKLAIDIWRKLPTALTTVIGPYISRGIP